MNTVIVNFSNSSQPYSYLTDIEDLAVGDIVVETPSSGFQCVKVGSLVETVDSIEKAYKWVVCKVDTAAYKARIEKIEKRKVLTAKLKKMQQEALEADQFAMLVKLNPDAAELAEELKSLA